MVIMELIAMLMKSLRFKVYGWLLNLPYTVNCKLFTNDLIKPEQKEAVMSTLLRLLGMKSLNHAERYAEPRGSRWRGSPPLLVLCLALALIAAPVLAQEQKIISTTEQQYQNMVHNASFESWSNGANGSSHIPDAWTIVGTPSLYTKLTGDKRTGSASLKVTADATGEGLSQVVTVDPSAIYTVSFYYKVDAAAAVTFNVSGAGTLVNQTSLNDTSWKRLAYKFTTGASDTSITIKMTANGAYAFYIDGMGLTRGAGIPAFHDYAVTDTGDHTVYGDIKVQDVDGSDNILLDKDTGNITLTGAISATAGSSTLGNLQINGNTISATNDSGVAIYDNASNGIFIEDGGNVGIGTTGPSSLLHINDGSSYGNTTGIAFGDGDTVIYESSDDVIKIDMAGVNRYEWWNATFRSQTNGGFSMQRAAGSASDPTYSIKGDSNTGIFSEVADTLSFTTGGT